MKKSIKKQGFIQEIKRSRASYLLLAPYAIIFFIFLLIPILLLIFLSFTDFDMIKLPKWIGLDNYLHMLFDDDIFPVAVTNTLIFAVVTGPVGYLLSFILAWSINDLGTKLRSVLTLAFYAPTLSANIYFIWKFIFSNDSNGIINAFLTQFGILREPISWLSDPNYGMVVVIVVLLWTSAGTSFLAFIAGLQSLNRELFEASAIDGIRNRWQELWYVTLPQMKPQLLLGAVFTISSAFSVGPQAMALTGFPSTDYSTHTLFLHVYDYTFNRYEFGYGSAIQVFLFAAMLAVWYFVENNMRKWDID